MGLAAAAADLVRMAPAAAMADRAAVPAAQAAAGRMAVPEVQAAVMAVPAAVRAVLPAEAQAAVLRYRRLVLQRADRPRAMRAARRLGIRWMKRQRQGMVRWSRGCFWFWAWCLLGADF